MKKRWWRRTRHEMALAWLVWRLRQRVACFENAGPVADHPVRPRTPPGVGTPLRAAGVPGRRHPHFHPAG